MERKERQAKAIDATDRGWSAIMAGALLAFALILGLAAASAPPPAAPTSSVTAETHG